MEIYSIPSSSVASNCYVIISGNTATVIDPSAPVQSIMSIIGEHNATLARIILTHGHFDHMLSADILRAQTGAPLYVHEYDAGLLSDGRKNAFEVFYGRPQAWLPPDGTLKDGDTVSIGEDKLSVILASGHTKGSICLLGDGVLFTGDTLFANAIGRTDLYGGDRAQLCLSLKKLRTLDPKLKIYTGHGDTGILSHALDNVCYYY